MLSLTERETILDYSGLLSYDKISDILNQLKIKTRSYNFDLAAYKKLLSASIELLENIYKYHEYFEDKIAENNALIPKFKIETSDNAFFLVAGNPILYEDMDKLKERIDNINKLDRQELRLLYKDTITNGQFSSKGGAGLGFIELKKMSPAKLNYEFNEIDKEFFYFLLEIEISKESKKKNV
jgi:hypothetical protein